jgi:hypothetical protein
MIPHPIVTPVRALLALVVLAASVSISLLAADPPQVVVLKNLMAPLRDGVRLATDVYLPAENGAVRSGKFPAILMRTPYGKNTKEENGLFFAPAGYAFVAQDVRGRFQSEDDFYIYLHEGQDGYDAVEWVARQPWCNGDVAVWGSSYQAATQNALAIYRPPHLKTMILINGTSNYIEDGAGRGGAFALVHNLAYAMRLAASGKEAEANPLAKQALDEAYEKLPQWLDAEPLKPDSPLRFAPTYQRWYADWRLHPTYDDYWKQIGYDFESYYDQYPEIPVLVIGGWYDIFKRGTLNNYQGLAARGGTTRLLMGPWTHTGGTTDVGDVDFGPEAKISIEGESLRWFDETLQGKDEGFLKGPAIKYFLMGGGEGAKNKDGRLQSGGSWKTAASWPPSGFTETKLYLHADGSLQAELCRTGEASRYEYDPRNPVPTLGGNIDSGKHIVPRGAQNQTPPAGYIFADNTLPLSSRPDVLTFETPPLEEDLEVTGPIRVELWVSSSAKDTDFTAKLIDVHPPSADDPAGYAMNLEDGILRMRFRDSRERETLLEPGAIYPITIDLWATANLFRKGHRIRLDISSSNYPMYDVNPNTGEPLARHTHVQTALNTIYHDAERPSCLVLPVRE